MSSISGLGNSNPLGFNTQQVISQIVNNQYGPRIDRLNNRVSQAESAQTAFKDLNSKVKTLEGSIGALTDASTFQQKAASSGDTEILEASVVDDETAVTGTQDVQVNQLAEIASVKSGQFLNDQKMAAASGATSISDFEQVEGTGTLDTSSDYLGQLSKSVTTQGSGTNDIRIQQMDGEGTTQTVEIDLDEINNFDDLETAIEDPGSSGAATTSTDDVLDPFDSTQFNLDFNYNKTSDKFSIQPTNQDGNGGRAITLSDINGSDFFEKIGFNNEGNASETFDRRQSDFGQNLTSIDPTKIFDDNRFTSAINNSGTIQINNTEISYDLDGGTDAVSTIDEFIDAVDEKVDGVKASINQNSDKVTLETTTKGAGEIDVSDKDGGNLADVLNLRTENAPSAGQVSGNEDKGQDSEILFNGDTITDSDNVVQVQGLELNLNESLNPGDLPKSTTVSVEGDSESITSDVNAFVKNFNKAIGFINEKSSIDAPEDTDGEENESGPFAGSSTAQTIKNKLTDIVTQRFNDAVVSGNQIENLSDIGIQLVDPLQSSPAERGKLKFDENKFKDALENNPDQLEELFTAESDDPDKGGSQDGLAVQLNSFTTEATGTDGFISARVDGFDSRIERLNDRLERQRERAQEEQSRLQERFFRLEQQVVQLQQQQSALGRF